MTKSDLDLFDDILYRIREKDVLVEHEMAEMERLSKYLRTLLGHKGFGDLQLEITKMIDENL